MPERELPELIADSLKTLAREHPPLYGRLVQSLAGLQVHLTLDNSELGIRGGEGAVTVGPTRDPQVHVRTSGPAILGLLDGRVSLTEALECGLLDLRGDLEPVLAVHQGLLLYLHGAVRCPSFPDLFLRLRMVLSGSPSPTARCAP